MQNYRQLNKEQSTEKQISCQLEINKKINKLRKLSTIKLEMFLEDLEQFIKDY